jgi:DNA polymerase-3 subunit delta
MVAVGPRDAERYLASPPDGIRLFLVFGNDAGAVTERARLIEQVALKRGGGDRVLRFGSDEIAANLGRIADEAYSASLFGGEPVIGLRVLDGRHNVTGALEPLFERPPDAAWVVVEAGELTPSSALRKAFESAPRAAALPTYQAEGAGLAAFVRSAAEEAGLTIEPAALELILANLGGDRMASRRELEKLFLYVGDAGAVTIADVEAVLSDTAEARTDQVIDAALLGDSEAVELGLDRLKADGSSAAGLGAQALRHLLMLQALRAEMATGASAASAVERARPPIYIRRRSAVEAALKRWPPDALVEARARMNQAIATTRLLPSLEAAAISEALHAIALEARRRRNRAGG